MEKTYGRIEVPIPQQPLSIVNDQVYMVTRFVFAGLFPSKMMFKNTALKDGTYRTIGNHNGLDGCWAKALVAIIPV